MASRFAALMAKFPRPAPAGPGPHASAAPPAAAPAPLQPAPAPAPPLNACSDSEEDECSVGALRARLCAAGAASPAPPAAAPAALHASTSPVKRLGKARACATPSAPAPPAPPPQQQQQRQAAECEGREESAEEEDEEEVEAVAEEEEEELQVFSLKELKKSAHKAPAPARASSGGGSAAEDALDYDDGWLVRDDVCEYEDGEGSLLFDDEEEGSWEEEEEEEEEEAEGAEAGLGSACEAENALPPPSCSSAGGGGGGCSSGAATPARLPPLLAPSRFPGQGLPPPTPRAAAAARAAPPRPTPAPAPRPSFAGLKDGAPHPASGLVLIREELGLAPLAAQRHAFRNRAHRDALTAALYAEYNARVFGGRLPPALPPLPPGSGGGGSSSSSSSSSSSGGSAAHEAFQRGQGVPLEWRGRLTRTAGLTFSSLHSGGGGGGGGGGAAHAARIALSVTVLDTPLKLAQTLLHEMCHVAVWVLCHVQRPPHGAEFKSWARSATAAYPLRAVTVCHNYKVETRYVYACSACGVHVGRHSKSIAQGEACRACGAGSMALLPTPSGCTGSSSSSSSSSVSSSSSSTAAIAAAAPATPRAQSKYMLFIANERSRVAREMPGLGPKETMAELARRWGLHKQGAGGLAEALGGLVIEVD